MRRRRVDRDPTECPQNPRIRRQIEIPTDTMCSDISQSVS